jgi:hypothetical protein
MKNRKGRKHLSLFLIIIFLMQTIPLDLFAGILSPGETDQEEITIDYSPEHPSQLYGGIYFAKSLGEKGTVNILGKPNKVISRIVTTLKDNTEMDITPSGVSGQAIFSGNVSPKGISEIVTSKGNAAYESYYAWYRSPPEFAHEVGPEGVVWEADVKGDDGNSYRISCGKNDNPSVPMETINGISMPQYPGCNSSISSTVKNLRADITRDQPYRLSDNITYVQAEGVGNVFALVSINEDTDILAPGVPQGRALASKINILSANMIDSSNYSVRFQQDFNWKSPAATTASPYGQKNMVYYTAFVADLTGMTYKYPTKATVYYKDAVGIPESNLSAVTLTVPACIEAGKSETYTYSFQNTGGADITTSFTAKIFIEGVEKKSTTYTQLNKGVKKTETFTHSFSSTGNKSVSVILSKATNETITSDNTEFATVEVKDTCTPDDIPETVNGDFTIEKPRLKYGQNNGINIVNVVVSGGNGCAYQSFTIKYTQGSKVDTNGGNGKATSFNGLPYPKGMGVGFVNVSVSIKTTCGTVKDLGTKSFEIYIDSTDPNSPPVFQAGFVNRGNMYAIEPLVNVQVGTMVDLQILQIPKMGPDDKATPYDPDGDPIIYIWDFDNTNADWVKTKYEDMGWWQYDERYSYFIPDKLGTFQIQVTAMDYRGASSTRTVTLNVIPPNPIPVITVPPKIVEGRTYTPEFSGAGSYSPFGYAITQYIWGNKQSMYPTAGQQTITLDVVDSNGLHAITPASQNFTVLPDQPPVVDLQYNTLGVRGVAMNMRDKSYSPDNDPISDHTISLSYDSNGDGSFLDETPSPISFDSSGSFTINPTKVGNYKIHIYMREGLGYRKSANKDFLFEITNIEPTVDYSAEGVQPQPANIISIAPTGNELATSTEWQASSVHQTATTKKYNYVSGEDALETPGLTYIQPYKSITSSNLTHTWMRVERSYCGDCGNTGSTSGYYPSFDKTNRIDRNVWYDGANFYNEDNPSVKKGSTFIGAGANGEYDGEPFPRLYNGYIKGINVEANMIWTRSFADCTYCYYDGGQRYEWTDYFYRISDIKAHTSVSWPSSGIVQPYHEIKTKQFITYPYPPAVEPPPPSYYIPPPKVAEGTLMESINYNYHSPTEQTPLTTFNSQYAKDFLNNTYKNSCSRQFYSQWLITDCNLELFNSVGSKLWTFGGGITTNTNIAVDYVSSDSSKALVSWGYLNASKALINNTNGATILDFVQSGSTRLWYLGVHEDKLAYVSQTVETAPGYSHINFKRGFWELLFYDLKTGVTTSAGNIKTFSGFTSYSSGYGDTIWTAAVPRATISSDGKLLIANYYTNVLIYDMKSNQQEADIPTGRTDPQNYISENEESDDYSSRYSLNSINLAEDGELKIVYGYDSDSGNSHQTKRHELTLKSDVSPSSSSFSYGFLSDGKELKNGEITVKLKFNKNTYSDSVAAGVGFRSQDNKNMYRVELSPRKLSLTKLVNGTRTVLAETNYNAVIGTFVSIKAKVKGDRIIVYADGVPYLDLKDSSFTTGKYGTYSEVPYAILKDFRANIYEQDDETAAWQALVAQPIIYNSTYTDLENDPAISNFRTWTFTNLQPHKFLDAGDGYSEPAGVNSYNGLTMSNPTPTINRVGYFKVGYQETDDPYPEEAYKFPNMNFNSFRKASSITEHNIVVHRAPISQFTLSINLDNTISWDDTSYDPDRWLSPTNYSTESTGINYQSTRGITERRYNYTDPDGLTQLGKITRPAKSGVYTARLAVKDEYGAWSDWYEQSINVIQPAANIPPVAVLTFPNGTQTNPSYATSLTPTITWNQSDADPDTTFSAYHVVVRDQFGNTAVDSGIRPQGTTATTANWILNQTLLAGSLYQVTVRVSDGRDWSDWSNIGWMITNRPPSATMTVPSGTQAAPTIFSTLRPQLQWNQTDPDPGTTFTYFQIQVTNEANDTMILDSGQYWQGTNSTTGSWTVTTDLPAGQKLRARVRTFDGFAWSDWSAQTWMYINRAPTANFNISPATIWEGDTITLTNISTDPDNDALTYLWSVENPNQMITTFTTRDINIVNSIPGAYTITLTATDPYSAADTITKSVLVNANVLADIRLVHSTEEFPPANTSWEEFRIDRSRTQSTFYAGEPFIAEATTSANAVSLGVHFDLPVANYKVASKYSSVPYPDYEGVISLSSSNQISWNGEYWKKPFYFIPDGTYTITFTATYANGSTKTDTYMLVIKDSGLPLISITN